MNDHTYKPNAYKWYLVKACSYQQICITIASNRPASRIQVTNRKSFPSCMYNNYNCYLIKLFVTIILQNTSKWHHLAAGIVVVNVHQLRNKSGITRKVRTG